MIKPGDKVIRIPIKERLPNDHELWKGHLFSAEAGNLHITLPGDTVGVVREVIEDSVYIEGFGDWPHHIKTLRKVVLQ